jgi:ring-1,2-phenylacetyl-CoA epoxidase subunit PaaE
MADFRTLRIRSIRPETPEARSYVLEPTDGVPLIYRAGQFLTLILDQNGHDVRRSYSLASAPGIDPAPMLTIKRVPNGAISRYLLDHLRVGDELRTLDAAGRFTLTPSDGTPRDLVFFAAGSGITPVFSLLKTALHTEPTAHCTLIYSNRRPESTLFLTELTALAAQFPDQLTVDHWWSQPRDGLPRRLNNVGVEHLAGRVLRYPRQRAEWYLCGPEEYARMIGIVLRFTGLDAGRIHRETFVVEAAAAPVLVPDAAAVSAHVTIHYRGQTHEVPVRPGEYILTAALRQGVGLPYSCRGGRCSTCLARCTRGQIRMTINDVLTDRDQQEGLVLTCTAIAETAEVTLEF